ncbi:unnamed protein product [Linum trigynum]|uniref:Uncharacterized protein n=1 Tax=Linum trigynum TaxID=586398 RepID=A0AAV2D2A8_9ROSI
MPVDFSVKHESVVPEAIILKTLVRSSSPSSLFEFSISLVRSSSPSLSVVAIRVLHLSRPVEFSGRLFEFSLSLVSTLSLSSAAAC